MSRSSACIQMLLLLKARGFMTRLQLAEELHCNVRNILEYKKELEYAGYTINSTTGKYGGYTLERGALLPVQRFDNEEVRSLQEARNYIKSHHDFLMRDSFESAMNKLQANIPIKEEQYDIYMEQSLQPISEKIKRMIQQCEQAKKYQCCIELQYRSLRSNEYALVRVHPYEVLNYQGSYYCLGYSLKAKDYRIFKFSEERMKQVTILDMHFQRDKEFRLMNYIGKSGLVKGEVIELDLIIHNDSARRVVEKPIGIDTKIEWLDTNSVHFTTLIEGKMNCISFLLSLRCDVEILSPLDLKKEMLGILKDIERSYSISSKCLL